MLQGGAKGSACVAGVNGEGGGGGKKEKGRNACYTCNNRAIRITRTDFNALTNQKLGHAFFIRVAVFTWELTMFTSHFELLANWNFSA